MKDLRTPSGKVKGLGTSAEASGAFWRQRLSALALIPLVTWFCVSIALLPDVSYTVLRDWFRSPFHAVMMLLLVVVAFQHAQQGLQVIIEDYMTSQAIRIAVIIVVSLGSYFLMAVGVYSILKLALGG